jgi:hypothetical protein
MDVELRMIALPLSINIGVLNGPATAVLWFYAVMLQSTRSGQSDYALARPPYRSKRPPSTSILSLVFSSFENGYSYIIRALLTGTV